MTEEQVFQTLMPTFEKVIKSNNVADNLTIESNLFHAGLDSLGVMELLVDIENNFKIVFNDDELSPELFESVKTLVDKIFYKLKN